MTWASMSRALSQRASQKPSRPASKATQMRLILCPAFSASSRHRCSSFSNVPSSTLSFFNGWRSTPGTRPATSQLDWLISMTAISVPSGSRGLRDRLRSFNFSMGCSIGSNQRRWMQYPRRRPPHSIPMTNEAMSPLRRRMIEDMTVRKFASKTQRDYVQRVKHFTAFLGRSPDTASFEDVRSYQLHLAASGAGVSTLNQSTATLRFFFRITLKRSDIIEHTTFIHEPRKLPVVLSPEE